MSLFSSRPARAAVTGVASLAALSVLAPLASSDAQVATADRAARGLDLFVHAPDTAAPGSLLPVQVEVFGFPTASTLVPLSEVSIEAGWDPEYLGEGVTAAPPSVRATSDANGRAQLLLPVPAGAPRDLHLLLVARSGQHTRSRFSGVHRRETYDVSVYVAESNVVPGSTISAWVAVNDASTGKPAPNARVSLHLDEGGVPRFELPLTTDGAGTATARVPIPYVEEPGWRWTLVAAALTPDGLSQLGSFSTTLAPREETPGTPSMRAWFDAPQVFAGDKATFTVRVRDASDQPVASLPVRYWVGPKGTVPPATDEAWEKLALRGVTDAEGAFHATADAPTLVSHGVGTTLRLVTTSTVDGHTLKQEATIGVDTITSTAQLRPEAYALVPGVSQRIYLSVFDGRGRAVTGTFAVKADGLDVQATTNEDGEAEIAWTPPLDVGALRNVGPCAGGVAAAVTVRPVGDIPALASRKEPFALCVPIDRDVKALVSVDHAMARSGDKIHVRVLEPKAAKPGAEPASAYSVILTSADGARAASVWMDDADRGADLVIPEAEPGAWSLSVASPSSTRSAKLAVGGLTVIPKVLPKLYASVVGGRATPGGTVEVDVDLKDEKGRGLPGTVAALVTDAYGGGSIGGLARVDARSSVCGAVGVGDDRCDRFLEGDPALEMLRRSVARTDRKTPITPTRDPGGSAREELRTVFGEVMRSLEGAVYEASASPDRINDVRRKTTRGSSWNPELMTLVTAAMSAPPETPGGEPIALPDLLAVDPQVTFDNVARRIARLKLFYVLQHVRTWKRTNSVESDEPVLKDPNAILRRLVRNGTMTEDALLDPWGGTIQFVTASGPSLPFLTVARGFELRAPGPDGRIGTGDDVRDPFERVLRSGSPYAREVSEDRVVDARLDMEVAESTVTSWQTLLEEATGRQLGAGSGGISGTGDGYGYGRGALSGSHRALAPTVRYGNALATGVVWWSPPQRTDARGHLRLRVPLGDIETTYRIAFIGVPDAAPRASGWVDVPVSLPLSAHVDTGVSWVEGDRAAIPVALRNRTKSPIRATVTAVASGVATMEGKPDAIVDIPAGGTASTPFLVSAARAGDASIAVTVRAPGLPDDVLHHAWRVVPPGEPTDLTRSQWVGGSWDRKATLTVSFGDRPLVDTDKGPLPVRLTGAPRLVLERGLSGALAAALGSLDPDTLVAHSSLLDAIEVASRVRRWAIAKDGDASPLAARAREVVSRATGRLTALGTSSDAWAVQNRLRMFVPSGKPKEAPPSCPPADLRGPALLTAVDAEPAPDGGAALACWDKTVVAATEVLATSGQATDLARVYLALADRPHRSALASNLIDRLREKVALRPTGAISLPDDEARSRSSRAIVYAALLRGSANAKPDTVSTDRLATWVAVQRDADGGYGSALATREVVRALLGAGLEEKDESRVKIVAGDFKQEITVGPSASVVIPLPASAVSVSVEVEGPGLAARLERPVLRLWSSPPPSVESPLRLGVTWPSDAHAGAKGTVSIAIRHTRGRPTTADIRVPLPPGATLAEGVPDVRQVQGALLVRVKMDGSDLGTQVDLPVRFGIAGRVTVPEARATVAFEEQPRALAVARPLVIQ